MPCATSLVVLLSVGPFRSVHLGTATAGINIILAVLRYLGQLPLGHAGFMAVSAYTCALFTKYSPLPDGVFLPPTGRMAGLGVSSASRPSV